MRLLDVLFSSFRWYRSLTGGTWYNVTPSSYWEITAWVRGPRYGNERVNCVEQYD